LSPREVILRIIWHPEEREEDYLIVIRHRGAPRNEIRIPLSEVSPKRWFLEYEGKLIPYHRVLRIERKEGDVIWSKGRGE